MISICSQIKVLFIKVFTVESELFSGELFVQMSIFLENENNLNWIRINSQIRKNND